MLDANYLFEKACDLQDSGDYAEAFDLFKQAAELGDASSQNNLAVCYELGKGVLVNTEQALFWYEQAINSGEISSLSNLADLYAKLSKFEEAETKYLEAIRLGDNDALLDLASMYLKLSKANKSKVICLLEKAVISDNITEDSKDLAHELLFKLK